MGIHRAPLSFEGKFVQIPNSWARDARISRRARGLLVEVASHRVGWHITTRSLTAAGVEGRDAVRAMIHELVVAGYLEPEQKRGERGHFGEIEYVLADPFDRDGKSDAVDSGDPRDYADPTVAGLSGHGGLTGVGFTVAGSTVDGESATKNTRDQEDHLEEDHFSLLAPDGSSVVPSQVQVIDEAFERFYAVYPRKTGRLKARAKFESAVKAGTSIEVLLAAVERYAADPNQPTDRTKIPHPATWLYQGRWDDEPLPARGVGQKTERAIALVDEYRREEQEHEEIGHGNVAGLRAVDAPPWGAGEDVGRGLARVPR